MHPLPVHPLPVHPLHDQLLAVGWEGVWGLVGVLCLLIAMQLATVDGGEPLEDSILAIRQILSHPSIVPLMAGNALSIAFFNFFGMSITKTSSAAYRMVGTNPEPVTPNSIPNPDADSPPSSRSTPNLNPDVLRGLPKGPYHTPRHVQ